MPRAIKNENPYKDKLLKLIPTEIVAAYMVIMGLIPAAQAKWGLLIVTIILFILVPFYLKFIHKVTSIVQIIFTALSFIVWVYSLGGPFFYWGIYEAWIASVILVIWTLFIPLFVKVEEPTG